MRDSHLTEITYVHAQCLRILNSNAESDETVEHLCAKCDNYSEEWGPVADKIWAEQKHAKTGYENYTKEKVEHPELAAFEHADGTVGLRDEDLQLKYGKKAKKEA